MDFWKSKFGEDYTERNTYSVNELDSIYKEQYGYTRSEMNKAFIQEISLGRTLEVGCNVGNILLNLQSIGLESLYGIELQHYAVERSKSRCQGINIIQGSAFDIPFKNNFFDMVFTSGVLIHLSPEDIKVAMDEMYRVSNKYIWGFEYYAEEYMEIEYYGNGNKMWKTNFAQLFLDRFNNLKLVKEKKYPYLKNANIDQMYLLEIIE
jgi:pseudaminic acid biosynthesis-associated methylase